MKYTIEEARHKRCPIDKKYCKAIECMCFVKVGIAIRDISIKNSYDKKTGKEKTEEVEKDVYVCGFINSNLINKYIIKRA